MFSFSLLLIAAFFAGFVDSIVGGGGLLQVPALMLLHPHAAIPTLLAANKMASSAGTAFAVFRYRHQLKTISKKLFWFTPLAFITSYLGAKLVGHLPETKIKSIICVLLAFVTLLTFMRSQFGLEERPHKKKMASRILGIFVIALIGAYDGFLGPGTGSFFIFAFISIYGFHFLRASAISKVMNLSTNIAAIICFWNFLPEAASLGIPMAFTNIMGSYMGTFLANKHGASFVRKIFLATTIILLIVLMSR